MINFFSRHFPPPHDGGGQVFFENLLSRIEVPVRFYTQRNAIELNKKNIQIIRLSFVPQSRNPSSGMKIYWSTFVSILYFSLRSRRLKNEGIHIGQIWPYGMIGLTLKKIFGIKYTIFILGEELSSIIFGNGIKKRIIAEMYRKIVLNASHVFAYSSFVRENVKKLLKGNLPDAINVFSTGLEPEKFCSMDWKYHKLFCPKEEDVILFSVSRHIERKGFDVLIESVKLLNEKKKNWHLYIGGQGPLTDLLKRKVNENNLKEHVTFLGLLEESELHGCYRRADVFILTNRMLENGDADGCPIVFLEASSYGMPCIGGNVPGTQDAIVDDYTGFIVDSQDVELISDKLSYLIRNKTKRELMGKNAEKFIERKYKWKDRINKFGEINDKISNK